MKRSTDRILTTHTGSLPRPDALQHMMAEGTAEPTALAKAVREAVFEVVKRQTDAGIDIVDDGEQSKPGFITYIDERLSGMAPRTDNPPQLDTREKRSFPEFYAHGHSGSRPPPRLCTSAWSVASMTRESAPATKAARCARRKPRPSPTTSPSRARRRVLTSLRFSSACAPRAAMPRATRSRPTTVGSNGGESQRSSGAGGCTSASTPSCS